MSPPNANGKKDRSNGRWMTTGTAARLLGISQDTVSRYADKGKIQSRKLPSGHRRVLITPDLFYSQEAPSGPILDD